jgi:carbon monoxide dehydrogenase subunit G
MPSVHETIATSLPIEETFGFVADFANARYWDPGVLTSERLDPGPVGLDSRYRLLVRMGPRSAPMEYRVTAFEPPRRVVLTGEGSNVRAVDEIRFEASPDGSGTRIDYTADIRLVGLLRLVEPFAGRAFRRIAEDARDGMERALEERSRSRPATPA